MSNNSVINNSNVVINQLLEKGKQIFVVSNNCSITREDLLKKCQKLGFNFTIDNILTAGYVTTKYLKSINFDKKAYVIGSEEFSEELTKAGINHIGIGRDDMTDSYGEYFAKNYNIDEEVGAVIVSLDKFFTIPKLLKAMNYLKNPKINFIATNNDIRSEFPTVIFPDAGPIISAVENGSYRKATVIGKPSTFTCDLLELSVAKERMLMIGDRLSVDIAFGHNVGMKTLLVETGDDKMKNVEEICSKGDEKFSAFIPDFVIESLGKFLQS